jgi:hypothetical protein
LKDTDARTFVPMAALALVLLDVAWRFAGGIP